MVMFAANQYPDGRRKDTVLNAELTGWFAWNMATYDLREAVNASASAVAAEIDELLSPASLRHLVSLHLARALRNHRSISSVAVSARTAYKAIPRKARLTSFLRKSSARDARAAR